MSAQATNDEQQAPVTDRLSDIRARLDAATPVTLWQGVGWGDPDGDLIDHAPADIAWLLEQVEDLTRRVRMYEVVKS